MKYGLRTGCAKKIDLVGLEIPIILSIPYFYFETSNVCQFFFELLAYNAMSKGFANP